MHFSEKNNQTYVKLMNFCTKIELKKQFLWFSISNTLKSKYIFINYKLEYVQFCLNTRFLLYIYTLYV